jgi:hypothetical protein
MSVKRLPSGVIVEKMLKALRAHNISLDAKPRFGGLLPHSPIRGLTGEAPAVPVGAEICEIQGAYDRPFLDWFYSNRFQVQPQFWQTYLQRGSIALPAF